MDHKKKLPQVCMHWKRNSCFRGDRCLFMHGYPCVNDGDCKNIHCKCTHTHQRHPGKYLQDKGGKSRSSRSPRWGGRSRSPRRRSRSPRGRSRSPRGRSRSPRGGRNFGSYPSPRRRRSPSPYRRRSRSPGRHSRSPNRYISPRRNSRSPRYKSPRRYSRSPKRRSRSLRRRSSSKSFSRSPRRRSRSPKRTTISQTPAGYVGKNDIDKDAAEAYKDIADGPSNLYSGLGDNSNDSASSYKANDADVSMSIKSRSIDSDKSRSGSPFSSPKDDMNEIKDVKEMEESFTKSENSQQDFRKSGSLSPTSKAIKILSTLPKDFFDTDFINDNKNDSKFDNKLDDLPTNIPPPPLPPPPTISIETKKDDSSQDSFREAFLKALNQKNNDTSNDTLPPVMRHPLNAESLAKPFHDTLYSTKKSPPISVGLNLWTPALERRKFAAPKSFTIPKMSSEWEIDTPYISRSNRVSQAPQIESKVEGEEIPAVPMKSPPSYLKKSSLQTDLKVSPPRKSPVSSNSRKSPPPRSSRKSPLPPISRKSPLPTISRKSPLPIISRQSPLTTISRKSPPRSEKRKNNRRSYSSASSSSSSSEEEEEINIPLTNLSSPEKENVLDKKKVILTRVWKLLEQKKKLDTQRENIVLNHKGDTKSLNLVIGENDALSREIDKQLFAMNKTIMDLNKSLGVSHSDKHQQEFYIHSSLNASSGSLLTTIPKSPLHKINITEKFLKPKEDNLTKPKNLKSPQRRDKKPAPNLQKKAYKSPPPSRTETKGPRKMDPRKKKLSPDPKNERKPKLEKRRKEIKKETVDDSEKRNTRGEYAPSAALKPHIQYIDQGFHWCQICNDFLDSVPDYIKHLESSNHASNLKRVGTPWLPKCPKVEKKDPVHTGAPVLTIPLQGTEFIYSHVSFFCSLCGTFIRNVEEVGAHSETNLHASRYKDHLSKNPMYETTYNKKKMAAFAKYSVAKEMKKSNLEEIDESNEKDSSQSSSMDATATAWANEAFKSSQEISSNSPGPISSNIPLFPATISIPDPIPVPIPATSSPSIPSSIRVASRNSTIENWVPKKVNLPKEKNAEGESVEEKIKISEENNDAVRDDDKEKILQTLKTKFADEKLSNDELKTTQFRNNYSSPSNEQNKPVKNENIDEKDSTNTIATTTTTIATTTIATTATIDTTATAATIATTTTTSLPKIMIGKMPFLKRSTSTKSKKSFSEKLIAQLRENKATDPDSNSSTLLPMFVPKNVDYITEIQSSGTKTKFKKLIGPTLKMTEPDLIREEDMDIDDDVKTDFVLKSENPPEQHNPPEKQDTFPFVDSRAQLNLQQRMDIPPPSCVEPPPPFMNPPMPHMNQPPMSHMNPPMPPMNPHQHYMNPPMPHMNPPMPHMNPPMPHMNPPMHNMNPPMPNMNPPMHNMNPPMPHMNPPMPNMNPHPPRNMFNPYMNPAPPPHPQGRNPVNFFHASTSLKARKAGCVDLPATLLGNQADSDSSETDENPPIPGIEITRDEMGTETSPEGINDPELETGLHGESRLQQLHGESRLQDAEVDQEESGLNALQEADSLVQEGLELLAFADEI